MTRVVLLLSAFLTSTNCIAFSLKSHERLELLQPIRDEHNKQQNVGYSFVLSYKQKLVLRDFAGASNLAHDIPLTPDTRMSIMSITKAFIGSLILKEITNGNLQLSNTVSNFLPEYTGEKADQITIEMLLAHTSGIPHSRHPQRKHLYVEHYENATEALSIVESLEVKERPGSQYNYSSSGYNVLAAIIESVHKKPIQQVMNEIIFTPLKLKNTGYMNALKSIPSLARNYSYVDIWNYSQSESLQLVPTWDFSYNFGGGNMFSTADDLVKFGEAVLFGSWLTESEKKRMATRLQGKASNWSMGWIISADNSEYQTIHITGATPGVQASLYLIPEHQIVFAMVANSWGKNSAGGKLVIDAPLDVVKLYLQSVK